MQTTEEALQGLAAIPGLAVSAGVPLSTYTRFGIGGPAELYGETADPQAFAAACRVARASGVETVVIGGGTNLVVSDQGFRGIVLRFTANSLAAANGRVTADAGATLQELVDFTLERGLKGLETLTGIPGSVGAAVYGNAGAYGHSISERVAGVRFFDGERVRAFTRDECEFRYRESVFKRHKEWIVFSAELCLEAGERPELQRIADGILRARNEKFPVTMKCAGSVFKNLLWKDLPEAVAAGVPADVVREGKVPAAYFLEQAGAKGLQRGGIHVAQHHANLLYNTGTGNAAELRALIAELKERVRSRFGICLKEEVQYVGFPPEAPAVGK